MQLTNADVRRFWKKVRKTPSCWLWSGALSNKGYGSFYFGGRRYKRNYLAHRVAFTLLVGSIPSDLEIDHLCRTTSCVNPAHLALVTHQQNMRRSVTATKTHCEHGHLRNKKNTYLRPDGSPVCRLCHRGEAAARYVPHPKSVRAHCVHGHEFTPENTYRDKRGVRICRACARVKTRRWQRANVELVRAQKRRSYVRHRAEYIERVRLWQERRRRARMMNKQ